MSNTCTSCRQPLASLNQSWLCGLCQSQLCKECTQFLDPSTFSFLKNVPEELAHSSYCRPCYDKAVLPELEAYSVLMERAREATVFYKNERNLPPHRASKKKLTVENCRDRKETLLRLAFFAAEQSYNALVNVELNAEKVRNAGYQKTVWSGSGFPANVFMKEM